MPATDKAGDIIRDVSGHNNNGDLANTIWEKDGLSFNGTSGYANLGEGGGLFDVGTGDFAIFAVIRRSAVTNRSETIFSKWSSGYPTVYWLRLSSTNTLKAGHRSGVDGRWYVYSSTTLDTNQHSILLQRNTAVLDYQLFYDGEDETIVDARGTTSAYNDDLNNDVNVNIGRATTGAEWFTGTVLNLIMFRTALLPAQVKFLSDNPYFMYQIPEELYGYVAGAPPTGNPFWYYNMLKRRN
jgi:hypothetical protein